MPVFWVLAADPANHLYEQSEWYAKTKESFNDVPDNAILNTAMHITTRWRDR